MQVQSKSRGIELRTVRVKVVETPAKVNGRVSSPAMVR